MDLNCTIFKLKMMYDPLSRGGDITYFFLRCIKRNITDITDFYYRNYSAFTKEVVALKWLSEKRPRNPTLRCLLQISRILRTLRKFFIMKYYGKLWSVMFALCPIIVHKRQKISLFSSLASLQTIKNIKINFRVRKSYSWAWPVLSCSSGTLG